MPKNEKLPQSKKLIQVFILFSVLLLILLFLYRDAIFSATDDSNEQTTLLQNDNFQVSWTIEPVPVQVLTPNQFIIKLTDHEQLPIENAKLTIELSMIGMLCGTMSFTLQETEPGIYSGEGYPLMPGKWSAKLVINDQNNHSFFRQFKAVHPS